MVHRPILRPGLKVLRRDLHTIQLGQDWPGLAIIEDTPATQAVLDAVDGFRDSDGVIAAAASSGPSLTDCRNALATLVEAGAVVERSRTERPSVDPGTWTAWWLLSGPHAGADDIARGRQTCRVDVLGDGAIAAEVRRCVRRAGLGQHQPPNRADLVIVGCDDVPDRSLSDSVMQAGVPHVWVHLRDLVGVVGPLVLPGRTACLRCVDLARLQRDPTWTTIASSATAHRRPVEPTDPLLVTALAAWAVQEVAVWAGGSDPQSLGAVIDVPLGLGPVTTASFSPHPECGCGWHDSHDTMGA